MTLIPDPAMTSIYTNGCKRPSSNASAVLKNYTERHRLMPIEELMLVVTQYRAHALKRDWLFYKKVCPHLLSGHHLLHGDETCMRPIYSRIKRSRKMDKVVGIYLSVTRFDYAIATTDLTFEHLVDMETTLWLVGWSTSEEVNRVVCQATGLGRVFIFLSPASQPILDSIWQVSEDDH